MLSIGRTEKLTLEISPQEMILGSIIAFTVIFGAVGGFTLWYYKNKKKKMGKDGNKGIKERN